MKISLTKLDVCIRSMTATIRVLKLAGQYDIADEMAGLRQKLKDQAK